METIQIQTSWGPITLTFNGDRVTGCALPLLKNTPRKEFTVLAGMAVPAVRGRPHSERGKLGASSAKGGDASLPSKTAAGFFQTLEKKFPTIRNPAGTEFQKAVWRELKKIPRGQTRTYSEIARAIGHPHAMRAVGAACGANPLPLFIPCHRVIAKNGLGGFGSGLPWKKLLLRPEGWNGGTME